MNETEEPNILDLNDDCLIAITDHLHFQDLFALYIAHSRFHAAIENSVKNVCVQLRASKFLTNESSREREKFLDLFGNSIRNLEFSIDSSWTKMDAGKILTKYFSESIVQKCIFRGIAIRKPLIKENLPFFMSLKSLILDRIETNRFAFSAMLRVTIALKQLSIDREYCVTAQLLSRIADKQLEKLALGYWVTVEQKDIDNLSANVDLKELKMKIDHTNYLMLQHFCNIHILNVTGHYIYDRRVLNVILDLNNLTKLSMRFSAPMPQLVNFSALKAFFVKLAQYNRLNEFSFDFTTIEKEDEIFELVCKMTNLKRLRVFTAGSSIDPYLLKFATNLKKLNDFTIFNHDLSFDSANMEMICEFAGIAKELKILVFNMDHNKKETGYTEFYERLADVREKYGNQSMLHVEIFDRFAPGFVHKNNKLKMIIRDDFLFF